MKILITLFIGLISFFASQGANIDTVSVFSKSMKKNVRCVVITPAGYHKQSSKKYPVVYLLHGYSDSYNGWITRVPVIKELADTYQLMIVCPDGGFSSWYFDSPIDSTVRYETNIALEIPHYIDTHYRTIKDRKARAITGLSMGGHGGLFLGLRHAGFFGACGSMSGGLDVSSIRSQFHIERRLGDTTNTDLYRNHSVLYQLEKKTSAPLSIIIDCGVDDFFIELNRMVHQKMLALKIPHDYTERPGIHNWEYWGNAIKYQLLFFSEQFKRK